MACVLTADQAIACRDSVAGWKRFYITELENKSAITAAAGAITAFTLTTGKQFWIYDVIKETSEGTEKIVTSDENGTIFYEQEVKLALHKVDVTKRNEIHLLGQNLLMVIGLDRNGTYWLFGESNGLTLQPSERNWGKAMGDFNGYNLVLMGKEEAAAQTVASGLIATLTAAAV